MLKRLISRLGIIKALLLEEYPTIIINGTVLEFSEEDLTIHVKRSLVANYQSAFIGCNGLENDLEFSEIDMDSELFVKSGSQCSGDCHG